MKSQNPNNPLIVGDRVRVLQCCSDKFIRGCVGTVVTLPPNGRKFPIKVEFVGVKTTLRGEFQRQELIKEND